MYGGSDKPDTKILVIVPGAVGRARSNYSLTAIKEAALKVIKILRDIEQWLYNKEE